jgi:hypothetical protein
MDQFAMTAAWSGRELRAALNARRQRGVFMALGGNGVEVVLVQQSRLRAENVRIGEEVRLGGGSLTLRVVGRRREWEGNSDGAMT